MYNLERLIYPLEQTRYYTEGNRKFCEEPVYCFMAYVYHSLSIICWTGPFFILGVSGLLVASILFLIETM